MTMLLAGACSGAGADGDGPDAASIADGAVAADGARPDASAPDAPARRAPDLLLVRGAEITTCGGHAGGGGVQGFVDFRVGLEGRTIADVVRDAVTQGGSK